MFFALETDLLSASSFGLDPETLISKVCICIYLLVYIMIYDSDIMAVLVIFSLRYN
jgi:hypothetical protein